MTRSEAPCLYCEETFEFLSGMHLKTHFDGANSFERYKEWVAQEHGIDPSHEVFETPGALTRGEDFEEYAHLFS
jgi:hypothetical protein